MASDSVTLMLDGDPTLDDLTLALGGLRDLLKELAGSHAGGASITWGVSDLAGGSATGTFLGAGTNTAAVHAVATAYLEVGQTLGRGERPQPIAVQRAAARITQVLNGRVPSVRFETADDEAVVSTLSLGDTPGAIRSNNRGAYGAILGRVQTLSSRGGLRFTLYDVLHDRAVSCYLKEGQEVAMRDAWGRMALVRGWVKRDPVNGRPLSIRRVGAVEVRDEREPGEWRQSVGVLRDVRRAEPAETTIRRVRDAH